MYGPCLSSIDGEQALTPPKRHCLGRPLPYQLADTEQADPKAINLSCIWTLNTKIFYVQCPNTEYQVLPFLSKSYS